METEICNLLKFLESIASIASPILTFIIIIYNHKSIKLTQKSISQSVSLQLYEKRLELFNNISDDNAFENAPLSLKVLYTDEIYSLYNEIRELCDKRWSKISEIVEIYEWEDIQKQAHYNLCYEMFCNYSQRLDELINLIDSGSEKQPYRADGQLISLKNHIENTEALQDAIHEKYNLLEKKMREFLEQSIK